MIRKSQSSAASKHRAQSSSTFRDRAREIDIHGLEHRAGKLGNQCSICRGLR